jgi:hypothetical protein
MLGAGTVINPIIKIITTVVILGAIYLFLVKPALDTTNSAFDSFSNSFGGFDNLPTDIQSQIDDAFSSTGDTGRLQDCIQRAIGPNGADQQQINRCIDRFGS